jgi:phosphatidylglycerophosphatase A
LRIIKKKKIIDESYRVNPFVLAFNSAAYTGFAPIASGTVGSFVAACVLFINVFNSLYILLLLSAIFFLISLFTGKGLLKRYGDDPSVFVMDEVIGMWVTIIVYGFLCQKFSGYKPDELFVAFIFFRIFDIIKLPPVRYFDNMKNVFGVLTDDVIAGIQAGVIEFVVILLIKLFI